MPLYERNYSKGYTPEEQSKLDEINKKEMGSQLGSIKIDTGLTFKEVPASRHIKSLFPNHYLDLVEIKKNIKNIELTHQKFKELIHHNNTKEQDIISFIKEEKAFHMIGSIIPGLGLNFGHHDCFLFPEFKLGQAHRCDYLIVGSNSAGYQFVFVELEGLKRVTLEDGKLGEAFRDGINQVNDWKEWLANNYRNLEEYFKKYTNHTMTLPDEFRSYSPNRCHFVVVAGERKDFNQSTYIERLRYARESSIHIRHYDNLYDYSLELLKRNSF